MLGAFCYPISVAETCTFIDATKNTLTPDEVSGLIDFLAFNPEAGEILPGAAGIRTLVWSSKCSKTNLKPEQELRIVYYFRDLNMPLYLLAAFPASENLDLADDELDRISVLVQELVSAHRPYLLKRMIVGLRSD